MSKARNVERDIAKETAAAASLRESLKTITTDEEAVRDTIEGETDLHELIAQVDASIIQDEALVAGNATLVSILQARSERVKVRIERKRAAIEQAMQISGLPSLEIPGATLSVKNVPPKVLITNEADIPARFFVQPEPVLDKKALNAAVKEAAAKNETIPGTEMGNASTTLAVRRQ